MGIFDFIRKSLSSDIERLEKSEADNIEEKPMGGQKEKEEEFLIGQKGIITDPFWNNMSNTYIAKNKLSSISPQTLRNITMSDWLISTIIQTRLDTLVRFTRPEITRFDMAFRIEKRDRSFNIDDDDRQEINQLKDFIYHCGKSEGTPKGEECTFSEYIRLIARDALTYGHSATEKILTRGGALHRFRALPGETMFRVDRGVNKQTLDSVISQSNSTYKKKRSDNDYELQGHVSNTEIDYYKYVQMSMDNRILNVFGDEDMVFKLFNPQNFPDSNGYAKSMVEMAVKMVTNHLNLESYNANVFTNGYATRGILHIKGTVTQNNLAAFRRQFYNTISGSAHAWQTPIVAGVEGLQFVPLSVSSKEMEYLQYSQHVMRALCSQFLIDPLEVGLDLLTSGNGRSPANAKESGQFKIAYSRERGLLPLLYYIEDIINNDIIAALDKRLADKYVFRFTGYTDDTAQADVNLRQAQMTTFASMNDLLRYEEKQEIKHPIADLPINANFWTLVEKNLTRGEIREYFLNDKGAKDNIYLQYIPGDPAWIGWQQMLMTLKAQKEQKEMQEEQMKQQEEQMQQQQQVEEEQKQRDYDLKHKKHDMDREKHEREKQEKDSQYAASLARESGEPTTPQTQSTEHNPVDMLHEAAKTFGATKAEHIEGEMKRNPINVAKDLI